MTKWLIGCGAVFAGCVMYWTLSTDKPTPAASVAAVSEPVRPVRVARVSPRPAAPPEEPTSVYTRIFAGDQSVSAIAPEVLEAFLGRNRTNAQSLITAFQVTRDLNYLRLAAARFPNDPEVLFSVVAHDAFPENRREWLNQLKAALPDNGLGNYLSARDHFKNGQPELAIQDMMEGRAKTRLYEFTPDRVQGLEDLYLAAGKPAAEAKALAMANVLLPHLSQLRDLSKELKAAQAELIATGDYSGAQNLAIAGAELGQQLSRGEGARALLHQLVGLVIEDESLSQLPVEYLDVPGQFSAADRRQAIEAEKARVREAAKRFDAWSATAEEAQMISYFDRVKLYGEASALAWLENTLQP